MSLPACVYLIVLQFVVYAVGIYASGQNLAMLLNLHNSHLGLHIIFLNHSRVLHSLLNYNFLTIHDVETLRGLSHAATLQVIDNAIHFFTIH